MKKSIPEVASLKQDFLHRVGAKPTLRAAAWLYLYTSPISAFLAATLVVSAYYHAPELYETVGTGAGQHDPRWLASVVFNPLIESLMLLTLIKVSTKFGAGSLSTLIAATLMAILHSLQNLSWGLTVFVLFLIQSYAFYHVYESDFWRGYTVLSAAHALHNASVLIALSLLRSF